MKKEMNFQRLGGACQLSLEKPEDLRFVLELNDALWAMTSADTKAFIADKAFLEFLDADSNGRVRVDDVKSAVRWMLSLLRNLEGVMSGSDMLNLADVNTDNPEGQEICRTARIALSNLGLQGTQSITLAQISDQKNIIAEALQNGDGIIPPEPVTENERAAACIRKIMELIGKQKDFSGLEGIGEAELGAFETQAKARLAWLDECAANKDKILPFGDKTKDLFASFKELEEVLDSFFKMCEALSLSSEIRDGRVVVQNQLDPMDSGSVDSFLQKSPAAPVNAAGELDLDKVRHPLWRRKIPAFFAAYPDAPENVITAEFWRSVKARFAPYADWTGRKPETKIESWDPEDLREYLKDGTMEYLHLLMTRDKEVKKNLDNCATVSKLILFQRNMLEFLNNFVTLDRIFDRSAKSMLQAGHLVMDGRLFTLCVIVNNVAEHKKIVESSNICVMYLDAVSLTGGAQKTMKLAVAVTSGTMRHLFVGKSGIFYTGDGGIWDAKVFDFIQQPVSIMEAIKMPFYKFGDFIQKQADKFFATRSKQYEDSLAKDIQSKSALPAPDAKAPAAPPASSPMSGSMLLMGGGVGIAAIGSAFAFIAKSIQGISIMSIIAVILGIMLIFGGPIILVSLCKLFRRNLSIFLEANGFALNGQMRLSLRMGRFFTYTPPLPGHVRIFKKDLLNVPDSMEFINMQKKRNALALFLLLIVLAECVLLIWIKYGNFASFWQ